MRTTSSALELRNASFSWGVSADPVIKHLSMQLLPGSFTFLIGPVGCGKTTILKGILGELQIEEGTVSIKSNMTAYVDQTSFVQNRSIRENILGENLYDRDWYNKVVYACALDRDINDLPYGDGTLVGTAGIALSGGQKLRLVFCPIFNIPKHC